MTIEENRMAREMMYVWQNLDSPETEINVGEHIPIDKTPQQPVSSNTKS